MQALFLPDGDRLVPTELARGPWRPDAQHGSPPAALLGRATEAEATSGRVARIGVEHRFAAGGFGQPGPAVDWIRLLVPLAAGEDRWIRLAAASRPGPTGVGRCSTAPADLHGPIGTATQSLMAISVPGPA